MNKNYHHETILWRPAGLTKKTTNCSRSFRTAMARLLACWSSAIPIDSTASLIDICRIGQPPKTSSKTRFSSYGKIPRFGSHSETVNSPPGFTASSSIYVSISARRKNQEVLDNDALVADDRATA